MRVNNHRYLLRCILRQGWDCYAFSSSRNLDLLSPQTSLGLFLSLRQGWDSNSYNMDLQSIALTIQPPCLFCGEQGNRTLITLSWTCLANKRNQPVFTCSPVRKEWELNPQGLIGSTVFKTAAITYLLALPNFCAQKKASLMGDAWIFVFMYF